MNIKSLLFISALVMSSAAAQAQGIMVKGKVVDQHNEPVIGATVGVDKGKAKTVTDIDGNFTLQVPANAQIVVNYIGMKPATQSVGGRRELNFVLQDDVNQLQDVVVVGYGTQKRGSITGSVAAVKGDEMVRTKNENPQNMLTGRVAGVRVWQKSSEPRITTTSTCVVWEHRWLLSTVYLVI